MSDVKTNRFYKEKEPKLSPALQLLTLVWQDSKYDSHGRVNIAMREALTLALCSGMAVTNLNESAILAWEAHTNREPFRGNNVTLQREGYVTGFDDEKGLIRLTSYASGHPGGKPEKLLKLSHEELKFHCPAPKKAKKKKEAEA